MSGTEKDRGQIGVGKSCLANRFVRPLNDDYYIDHISVLSQSDFSGRVVNNDHFLYWGDCRKTADDGTEYLFQVVEQTEFIDDATFQPFKEKGKTDPYLKRCTAVRLQSAEKLMYICKNQLGIEKEYEQKILPEGRIFIDGFVCVFDVSPVPNRNIERQADFCINILNNLLKTKKPIVFVTTKNDEATEAYVREAEKLMQRKEFKNVIPMVESSSHDAINVDMAFMLLAQLIDKTKQRNKILSYNEAARLRKDLLETSTETVTRLVQKTITEYQTTWSQANKVLNMYREWQEFVQLFGQEHAQKIFRRHVKWLREENLHRRLQMYMENLACTLQDLMPDMAAMNCETTGGHGADDWEIVQNQLKNHVDFEQYFFEATDVPWPELSDGSDNEDEQRIPFDVLDTPEAETVFKNHVNALQQEQKRLEWKKQFKKLLEETGYVTPGKQLAEVRVLFMGRECFEALSEHDCQQIYDNHQRDIIEKAKINFQELLLEHADLFHHFKSIEPSGSITQEDVKEITEVLKEDLRYKMLDRLDQDRKLMLFQHLGFVHCPIREHCPAYPNCMDALVERIIESKKSQSLNSRPSRQWRQSMHKSTDYTLNLLIMGADHLASDLVNEICLNCGEGEYIYDGQTYFLSHRIIDGEMETFKMIDFQTSGLVCVYSNQASFEYLKENLEKSLLCNLELEDKFESLALVLVYQPEDSSCEEVEIDTLRREGQQLADVLHCLFIDTSLTYYHHRTSQHQNYIYDIINHLIECVRMSDLKQDEEEGDDDDEEDDFALNPPDIRIILCMFCGDPFSVEALLGPMMSDPNCHFTSDRSITVETFIGDQKRRIEIILSSYHGANAFRDELVHGFILLYSTKRRASLATLNAFSMNIPNLPMQMLAITESASASAFFSSEMCQLLITEGNSVADRLRAHFMTSPTGSQLKLAFYTPFLKEVWDKKPEIEQAFHMEEPVTLDSGEGTLEHSMHHHLPQPPPRHESYLMKQQNNSIMNNINNNNSGHHNLSNSHDGSGSENYEHLPTRSLNSLNGPDDIKMNLNDNNEKYHMYRNMLGEKHMAMNSSYGPEDDKDDKARLLHQGRLEDSLLGCGGSKRNADTLGLGSGKRSGIMWNNFSGHHAFTTGRQRSNEPSIPFMGGGGINSGPGVSKSGRPKGPSQTLKQQPGKLNLKNFAIVNDAIARMNVNSDGGGTVLSTSASVDAGRGGFVAAAAASSVPGNSGGRVKKSSSSSNRSTFAPHHAAYTGLAGVEDQSDDDCDAEYAQVQEIYPGPDDGQEHQMYTFSQDTTPNKSKMRPRQRIGGGVMDKGVPLGGKYSETDSDSSSQERKSRGYDGYYKMNRKAQTHKRPRKKRAAIPVQPPKVPSFGMGSYVQPPEVPMMYQPRMKQGVGVVAAATLGAAEKKVGGLMGPMISSTWKGGASNEMLLQEDESSIDVSSPRDNNSPIFGILAAKQQKEAAEQQRPRTKEEEKLERRRAKEDATRLRKMLEKEKELEKKAKRKSGKANAKSGSNDGPAANHSSLADFIQSEANFIPLFLEKCVQFIEQEGLDSEGIYRVPGNRAHVDLLYQKFEEESNVDIEALDIPVNAVATALKDFFSKHLPPLFDEKLMTELEDIAGSRGSGSNTLSMEVKTDRSCRLLALRGLLNKMPPINFTILKYIFHHFVRVSENAKLNSMDSKNLAICWWPTLIPIEFTDMGHFEQLRPYLEDIVQTMIDQYPFLFCGKEAFVMV